MGHTILNAIMDLFTIQNFIFINIGICIGIIFGAIPGMSGNLAIIVLLPFTFTLNTIPALLMLISIYFGANFGGSISSILINTPGTSGAAATLIDGYPLAKKGYQKKALDTALMASTFGGFVSAVCLLFFAPQISKIAMNFGPPEYFALAIFGLSIIASVSGKSILKGLISGGFGMLIATVGIDEISGITRFTFGNIRLYNGIRMIAVLLGVYAVAQIIGRIYESDNSTVHASLDESNKNKGLTKKEAISCIPTMIRSSFIGAFIGAIPGTGGAISAFISYNVAKRGQKKGEKFGDGEIKGIAAPESANNGTTAATLIPLLTLGIPGDVVAATLLGAFTMHGLVVGPKLFTTSGPTVYIILVGCVVAQVFMFLQGRYLLPLFVKITNIPQTLLTTMLMLFCCAGAFAIANSAFDVNIILVFGVISYLMKKVDFPPIPIVLGMILGPIAESNLRNSLILSKGSLSIFITRPISLIFLIITIIFVALFNRNKKEEIKLEENVNETIAKGEING